MDEITVVQDELEKLVAVLANPMLFYQSIAISYEKIKHTVITQERVPVTLAGGLSACYVTVQAENGQQDVFKLTTMKVQKHADHL